MEEEGAMMSSRKDSHCSWILYQLSHKGSPLNLEAWPTTDLSAVLRTHFKFDCVSREFLGDLVTYLMPSVPFIDSLMFTGVEPATKAYLSFGQGFIRRILQTVDSSQELVWMAGAEVKTNPYQENLRLCQLCLVLLLDTHPLLFLFLIILLPPAWKRMEMTRQQKPCWKKVKVQCPYLRTPRYGVVCPRGPGR